MTKGPIRKITISWVLYAVLILVTVVVASLAWRVEHADYREGVITIRRADTISTEDRDAILTKVARPFVDYTNSLHGPRLLYVTISRDTNMFGPNDFRYDFAYKSQDDPLESGFLFGYNNTIDYWLPQLCDEGGCNSYPTWFKEKYPATYQAYLRSLEPTKK